MIRWLVLSSENCVGSVHAEDRRAACESARAKYGVSQAAYDGMGRSEQEDVRSFGIPPHALVEVRPL